MNKSFRKKLIAALGDARRLTSKPDKRLHRSVVLPEEQSTPQEVFENKKCWHLCPHCGKDHFHMLKNPYLGTLDDYFKPCEECKAEGLGSNGVVNVKRELGQRVRRIHRMYRGKISAKASHSCAA